ncbi:MAG: biopolymer transporter ExbD [Prolixibacteraceae bacterium]|jgi:biopolymer transport protein ExbD|nr:biopolymer transporter ExbD [Prolixibacteraceae bacterium]MBT6007509.1 biopolymer transporter ExbD [Prolixibacteraceae bacterium]MBT6763965.1 biopolymer transporter ExbD [Prolixibacteraceae bacterium]MBT7000000.1 biopolymer transporter ExbD [Prolixibacteraceae bacterium]MBT7395476.1 biopolymer transporter ExbD [Prolixibacteraceae bacterium]
MARKTPEVPSASLADIAFMLLIFFLVTTTMDVDSGLERRLPQWVNPEDIQDDDQQIKERNVFVVLVNRNNDLLVENEYARIEDLRERAKEFMANPDDNENLPEKDPKEVAYFGEVMVTKGVISLRNDLDTKYGTYLAVQNELVAAINELREELSNTKFGKSYGQLEDDQKRAIRTIYPSKISEAEPKKVGGN